MFYSKVTFIYLEKICFISFPYWNYVSYENNIWDIHINDKSGNSDVETFKLYWTLTIANFKLNYLYSYAL
jgi:hypothetical protein